MSLGLKVKVEGYLKKEKNSKSKTKFLSKYNKRWFTLDGEASVFYYAESQSSKTVSKYIQLKDIESVMMCENEEKGKKKDWTYFFKVETSNKNFTLCAETQDDLRKWIEAFEKILEHRSMYASSPIKKSAREDEEESPRLICRRNSRTLSSSSACAEAPKSESTDAISRPAMLRTETEPISNSSSAVKVSSSSSSASSSPSALTAFLASTSIFSADPACIISIVDEMEDLLSESSYGTSSRSASSSISSSSAPSSAASAISSAASSRASSSQGSRQRSLLPSASTASLELSDSEDEINFAPSSKVVDDDSSDDEDSPVARRSISGRPSAAGLLAMVQRAQEKRLSLTVQQSSSASSCSVATSQPIKAAEIESEIKPKESVAPQKESVKEECEEECLAQVEPLEIEEVKDLELEPVHVEPRTITKEQIVSVAEIETEVQVEAVRETVEEIAVVHFDAEESESEKEDDEDWDSEEPKPTVFQHKESLAQESPASHFVEENWDDEEDEQVEVIHKPKEEERTIVDDFDDSEEEEEEEEEEETVQKVTVNTNEVKGAAVTVSDLDDDNWDD